MGKIKPQGGDSVPLKKGVGEGVNVAVLVGGMAVLLAVGRGVPVGARVGVAIGAVVRVVAATATGVVGVRDGRSQPLTSHPIKTRNTHHLCRFINCCIKATPRP